MSLLLTMLLVGAIVVAFLILVPNMQWLRRMLGYLIISDILASTYVISTYAATGTLGGLTIAIFAVVGISLSLRSLKFFIGCERLAIGGNPSVPYILRRMRGQLKAHLKHIAFKYASPAPLNLTWTLQPPLAKAWFKGLLEYAARMIRMAARGNW